MRRPHVTLEQVEEVMGCPAKDWEGRCFEVASAIVSAGLVEGRAVYGHYLGPIVPQSLFYNRPIVQHGWIQIENHHGDVECIIDPTRWAFEGTRPYIEIFEPCCCTMYDEEDLFVCSCGHVTEEHHRSFFQACRFSGDDYDEGGNRWREEHLPDMPEFDPNEKTVHLLIVPWPVAALQFVTHLLKLPVEAYEVPCTVTVKQAVWLANLPLSMLGDHAGPVYRALVEADLEGFIPWDNRVKVLGTPADA